MRGVPDNSINNPEHKVVFEQKNAGSKREAFEGPAQIQLVCPTITVLGEVNVDKFATDVRETLEMVMMSHGMVYGGVAIKINQTRITDKMVEMLEHIRDHHSKELVEKRLDEIRKSRNLDKPRKEKSLWSRMRGR